MCPNGLGNNPNKNMTAIQYVTIHNTGNYSASAGAKTHAEYQYNGSGGREVSWHYTVDSLEVWQSFDDTRMCWHCGSTGGNSSSIGIEICVNNKAVFPAECENAARLTAELLIKHKLTVDRVKQHYDWSKKNCPAELRAGTWGITWEQFIKLVTDYFTAMQINTPILNGPTGTLAQMMLWAQNKKSKQFFIDIAPIFYKVATAEGVDPIVVYCQSAKETGYGNFGGTLDESFYNTCGMKTTAGGGDSDTTAHKRFASWEEGIQAQVDHLALYAGAYGYPKKITPDPRHFADIYGSAKTVESLSGRWAASADYGRDIVKLMDNLKSTPDNQPPTEAGDEPNAWAREAWDWSVANKLLDGTRPRDNITREEVASVVYRLEKL
jgi:hypothetical protein